jgi:hypothetical protein
VLPRGGQSLRPSCLGTGSSTCRWDNKKNTVFLLHLPLDLRSPLMAGSALWKKSYETGGDRTTSSKSRFLLLSNLRPNFEIGWSRSLHRSRKFWNFVNFSNQEGTLRKEVQGKSRYRQKDWICLGLVWIVHKLRVDNFVTLRRSSGFTTSEVIPEDVIPRLVCCGS